MAGSRGPAPQEYLPDRHATVTTWHMAKHAWAETMTWACDQRIRDSRAGTPTLKTDILFLTSLSNVAQGYLWWNGSVSAAVGRDATSISGPVVPFRASVSMWLAAAPWLVHRLNKAAPPAGGVLVWYLLYVVLHPGTIDWWPHQQLLSTSHEQIMVPTGR